MRNAVLVVLFLAACGSKSTPPPAQPEPAPVAAPEPAPEPAPAPASITDEELDALLGEMVVMIGELADATEAAKGDCGAVATGIDGVVAKHSTLLTRSAQLESDPAVSERADAWFDAHQADLIPAITRMQGAVEPCASDERVQKSLEAISG